MTDTRFSISTNLNVVNASISRTNLILARLIPMEYRKACLMPPSYTTK